MSNQKEQTTIQIEADAKAKIKLTKKVYENGSYQALVVEDQECCRHASVLHPTVKDLVEKHKDIETENKLASLNYKLTNKKIELAEYTQNKNLENENVENLENEIKNIENEIKQLDYLFVEITIPGINTKEGNKTEYLLLSGSTVQTLPILESRNLTKEEAMFAAQSFFNDMLDLAKVKSLLFVAAFDEGQSSFVLTNKTLETENADMFRLMATTAMQMEALQKELIEKGAIPEHTVKGGIITPNNAEFVNTMSKVKV